MRIGVPHDSTGNGQARQHRRETLNTIIDLLKGLPTKQEALYPCEEIFSLAADIHAALAVTGKAIRVADTFIAATAITRGLTLVNANTKHFLRVKEAGFPIALGNWRGA